MNPTTKDTLDLDDGRLYYETAGKGEALVLTHAAFLDSRMFDDIWEPLAEQFQVIRYDMRGFGRSSPTTGPLCRRRDLDALLNHLGVARAHLVGCSNGGQISLDLALEQPQRVASLTLVDSTPSGFELQGEPPRYLMEMIGALQNGDVDRANELQIRIWLDGAQREPGQVDDGLRQKALEMNRIPVAQGTFFSADAQPLNPPAVTRLESVHCPTLVVAGALDHAEVLRAADEMAARIPHAKKAIMNACGHVPAYEQPTAFVELLLGFFQNAL
ncbi:predicted hydrolase [Longilinea arvoryzae]|uniref:Predicted hydrolase n=1 Tax=Longilinea arvoryzae TaxID=360412 RepID=A0A0S7B6V8_9CHLR|nr:alpha/beta hydrolase [Longilinea arvoryzae]GAP12775.1 predicted hydrolase [Longilinea arvoryzae]